MKSNRLILFPPFFAILVFVSTAITFAQQFNDRSLSQQGQAPKVKEESYFSKPVHLIDLPTASILRGGDLRTSLRLYDQGGALSYLSVGISNRMMFGVSFGGLHVIGGENVKWNDRPNVHIAYRVVEENLVMPALSLGYDGQGYGVFWRRDNYNVPDSVKRTLDPKKTMLDRYSVKSRGFYLVVSKGYASLWKIGLHAGMSYSLEHSDGDTDPTIFMGTDMLITRDLGLVAEYDFATNDDRIRGANNGKGFLNVGFKWAITTRIYLEFDIKDLLAKKDNRPDVRRILRFVYYGSVK
ncbi:MAG: hypothetical protein GXO75_10220 [Calditrichaeota bacterium]|nr:hypothetical protein [Calditrichota bacterium]